MKAMGEIDGAVVHCSYSIIGNANIIKGWHKKRGFDDIGYHYIITRNGATELGRDIKFQGAHVKKHNKRKIGICLVGMPGKFTPEQYKELKILLKALMKEYGFGVDDITGHYEYDKKKSFCPGFDMNILREMLRENV